MKLFLKILFCFIIAAGLVFGVHYYHPQIQQMSGPVADNVVKPVANVVDHIDQAITDIIKPSGPCSQPILYSLGTFDDRFGITKTKFLADIDQASQIWSTAVDGTTNKNLFQYSDTGDLKINLIYDYRQQATAEMAKLGIVINNNKTTYDELKTKYTSLFATYTQEKNSINTEVATFNQNKAAYEQQVAYWNSRGGAPKAQYQELEQQRATLNIEAQNLNQEQASFNSLVSTINSIVVSLNKVGQNLNLNVKSYNTIGSSTGEQFDEGEYVQNGSEKHIDIYQFDNNTQLVRVLEHELGHALGLAHVNDPTAIMYYLNQGTNEKLTSADTAELRTICGSK